MTEFISKSLATLKTKPAGIAPDRFEVSKKSKQLHTECSLCSGFGSISSSLHGIFGSTGSFCCGFRSSANRCESSSLLLSSHCSSTGFQLFDRCGNSRVHRRSRSHSICSWSHSICSWRGWCSRRSFSSWLCRLCRRGSRRFNLRSRSRSIGLFFFFATASERESGHRCEKDKELLHFNTSRNDFVPLRLNYNGMWQSCSKMWHCNNFPMA